MKLKAKLARKITNNARRIAGLQKNFVFITFFIRWVVVNNSEVVANSLAILVPAGLQRHHKEANIS